MAEETVPSTTNNPLSSSAVTALDAVSSVQPSASFSDWRVACPS